MRKFTFVLVLITLLVASTAVTYAAWEWAGDPQVRVGQNTLVRILVSSEVSKIRVGTGGEEGKILADHGFQIIIKDNWARKICADGPFAVDVPSSGFSEVLNKAQGGCITGW